MDIARALGRDNHSAGTSRWGLVLAVAIAVALLIGGFAANSIGSSARSRLTVLTGNAYVGMHQATVSVGGWSYGIVDSVAWVDVIGSSHVSGWPACLDTPGTTVRVKFAAVPVTGPTGASWRQVAWVDCRGSVRGP